MLCIFAGHVYHKLKGDEVSLRFLELFDYVCAVCCGIALFQPNTAYVLFSNDPFSHEGTWEEAANTSMEQTLLFTGKVHCLTLFVVASNFAFELGVIGPGGRKTSLAHHILGVIGIAFVVAHRVGGTLIMLLLLDWTPEFIEAGCKYGMGLDTENSKPVFLLYITALVAVRVLYYPWMMARGIAQAILRTLFLGEWACGIFAVLLIGWVPAAIGFSFTVIKNSIVASPFWPKQPEP